MSGGGRTLLTYEKVVTRFPPTRMVFGPFRSITNVSVQLSIKHGVILRGVKVKKIVTSINMSDMFRVKYDYECDGAG
jgi:hypothetical protein